MKAGPSTSLLAQRGQYNMSFRPPRTLEHLGQLFRVFMDLWNPLTSRCFNINWPKPSTALTPNQPYLKPVNPSRSIILKSHSFTTTSKGSNIETTTRFNPPPKKPEVSSRSYFHILYPFGNFKGSLWKNQNHHVASSNPSCK